MVHVIRQSLHGDCQDISPGCSQEKCRKMLCVQWKREHEREKYKIRLLSWLLAAGQSRHEVDVNPVTEIVGQTTLTWCWCVCVCVKYLLHQFKICVHSSPASWRRKGEGKTGIHHFLNE